MTREGNGWRIFLGFHIVVLLGGVVTVKIIPKARLRRMRKMFSKSGGILMEDYKFFTRPDAAIRRNTIAHRSAK